MLGFYLDNGLCYKLQSQCLIPDTPDLQEMGSDILLTSFLIQIHRTQNSLTSRSRSPNAPQLQLWWAGHIGKLPFFFYSLSNHSMFPAKRDKTRHNPGDRRSSYWADPLPSLYSSSDFHLTRPNVHQNS